MLKRTTAPLKFNPILSNFGIIDQQKLLFADTPPEQTFMLGPCLLSPGIFICASSCDDCLTLSGGMDSTSFYACRLDRIIAEMICQLEAYSDHK